MNIHEAGVAPPHWDQAVLLTLEGKGVKQEFAESRLVHTLSSFFSDGKKKKGAILLLSPIWVLCLEWQWVDGGSSFNSHDGTPMGTVPVAPFPNTSGRECVSRGGRRTRDSSKPSGAAPDCGVLHSFCTTSNLVLSLLWHSPCSSHRYS